VLGERLARSLCKAVQGLSIQGMVGSVRHPDSDTDCLHRDAAPSEMLLSRYCNPVSPPCQHGLEVSAGLLHVGMKCT